MQLSIALLFAFTATLVSSQSVSSLVAQLPSCAVSCLASASSSVGCGISDYACQCGAKKAALTSAATPCVLKACSSTDALKTNGITSDICKAANTVQTSQSNAGSFVSGIYPATSATSVTSVTSVSYATYPATITTSAGGASGASATSSSPSSTSSSPAQVSGNAATKVQGGVFVAGAAMLAALAL